MEGVRLDFNIEVNSKKNFFEGGGVGWGEGESGGRGGGGGGGRPGGGGSKVWVRWVMWSMGDVNQE